jgi:hypothetical protein
VAVTITNVTATDAAGFLLAVIDGTTMVAVATNFTPVAGKASGSLNLNTTQLVSRFSSVTSGRAVKYYALALWDTVHTNLLGNDQIGILNNPYRTNMAAVIATNDWAEADLRYSGTSGVVLASLQVQIDAAEAALIVASNALTAADTNLQGQITAESNRLNAVSNALNVVDTNLQAQITAASNRVTTTSNDLVSAMGGYVPTNGSAASLTNFPALVVQTNVTDVTIGGWRFYNGAGSIAETTSTVGQLRDSASAVLYFSPTLRYLSGTNGDRIADFTSAFSVGPTDGTNLAVYATLTNLLQRVGALEAP